MIAVPKRIKKLHNLGMKIDEDIVYKRAAGPVPLEELMAEVILEDKANRNHPMLSSYFEGEEGRKSSQPYIIFFWGTFSDMGKMLMCQ